MFKLKSYQGLIVVTILLNLFAWLAYPNEIYAIDEEMQVVSEVADTKLAQAVLITEYLFTNTPDVGDKIDLASSFSIENSPDYQVVDYIHDDTGLDAFVLETNDEELILSIRGTEGREFDGDMNVDAKLVLNENDQYESLKNELIKRDYFQDIDYVIGHSLGGSMALNTSLWLNDQAIELKGAYVFAPAPVIDDDYLTQENISAINDVLQLIVLDNEILYNVFNEVAGNLMAVNPYDYFNYTLVSIDNDVNSSFANHYVSRFIPIVTGDTEAKYQYYIVH